MSRELYFSIFILGIFIITNIFHISTIINLQSDNLGLKLQLDLLNLLSNKCSYDENSRNPIIFVTPTVFRPEQKADLTRLGQTLSSVCNLIWIVVEDAEFPSEFIDDLINRLKIKGIHLTAQTPRNKKRRDSEPRWKYPRGVVQRNSALLWIKENLNFWKRGIVYFGDDDNTYDWRIFEEMRKIKQKIGVWPVGIVGGMLVETPLLKKTLENYTVIGFNSRWRPERPFPMDMAGFAINISLIHEHPMSYFNYESPRGFMESHFLQSFDIKIEDLEPLAMDCTKVLVWHTRTEKTPLLNNEYQKYFLAINISSRLTTVEEDAIF